MSTGKSKIKLPIKHSSRWGMNKRDVNVLISFFVATVLTFFISGDQLNDAQSYTLFILIISISLWLTEAVPPYSVGLLIVFLTVVLLGSAGVDDIAQYYQTWSSPIIFLMMGGFFMSASLKVTKLDKALFDFALSIFGSKPDRIILGLMLTTAVLSMLMSNTATTAMMIASISPFISKFGSKEPFTKAILLGIPVAASVGGMGTIIGSPPNAIAVASLEEVGIEIDFVSWMVYGLPVALSLVVTFWYLIIRKHKTTIVSINIEKEEHDEETSKELRNKQILTIVTVAVTLIAWLTTPIHDIHVAIIAAIPLVVFTFLGVLSAKDVRSIPWETLILVAGGLTLGAAIQKTGLALFYINKFEMSGMHPALVLVGFAFLTIVLSNIMSNTATTSLLIPIGMLLLPNHQLEIALITGLCASCAVLLPVSTPPNAIAYATGLLEQKDFRYGGIVIGLIGPVLVIAYVLLVA